MDQGSGLTAPAYAQALLLLEKSTRSGRIRSFSDPLSLSSKESRGKKRASIKQPARMTAGKMPVVQGRMRVKRIRVVRERLADGSPSPTGPKAL